MSRLPVPGSDDGTWGAVLNDFLSVSLAADGTIKATAIASKADDSSVVHVTGDQTIAGIKTFSSSPLIPTPISSSPAASAASKAYVDNAAISGGVPATTGSLGLIQLAGALGGTATSPTVPGLAGKEPTVTAGTTSQYYRGDKSWQTLDKTAVGLANVDNTSDANKPVSTATQTALNAKAPLASPTFTGTVTVPAPSNGTDATTKTYVDSQVSGSITPDATSSTKGKLQLTGDLGGTSASPVVAKVNGITLPGSAPATGQVLTATSTSATAWSTPASGAGDATTSAKGVVQLAGDLGGTAAAPTVPSASGLRTATTSVAISTATAPTAGQVLTATSGTAAAWSTPTTGSTTLAADTDVTIASPSNNQVLTYNSGTGKWVNQNAATGFADPTTTKGDLIIHGTSSTTRIPVGTNGQVLTADSTQALGALWTTPIALDATASDIQPNTTTGTAVAGSTGKAADAGHQHTLVAHDHTTTNKGGQIPVGGLSATGTASSSTFLRGDGTWNTPATGAQALTATAVKAVGQSPYAASPGDLIPVDASSGAVTITLPTAPADKSRIVIKKIDSSATAVTINTGGSDVFNKAGGNTSGTLSLQSQAINLQYATTGAIWYVVGDDLPLSQLDARYIPITAEGVANGVATLDGSGLVPTNQLPLSTQAITISGTGVPSNGIGLNGDYYLDYSTGNVYLKTSGSWGSSVGTLEPAATSSTAGVIKLTGDLAGTSASPVVAKVNGITLPGSAPATGQVLTATSTSATAWSTPASGAGDATTSAKGVVQLAGDLGGTGTAAATPKVSGIQGIAVSATAPTGSGQVLTSTSTSAANWQTPSGGGGSSLTVVNNPSSPYTATSGDVVFSNTVLTVNSPAASSGAQVSIKNTGTNTITFTPASGTVDGAASFTITNQYDTYRFICDGTNWGVF